MNVPSDRPRLLIRGRVVAVAFLTALVLVAVFSIMVVRLRAELRDEIHRKIIERDAAVLYPIALEQVAECAAGTGTPPGPATAPLGAVLKSAHQRGMLAIAVFDRDGATLEAVPATQLFVELPVDDYWQLQRGTPISRYHPAFPLDQYFTDISRNESPVPVLEVLLPLSTPRAATPLGFVRYYIDARPLARELATIDERIQRQTVVTLVAGACVVGLVIAGAAFGVGRAQRAVAERNDRLTRANLELTLAAKASAIGQITSHLIHGLQGPVQGLREAMASREAGTAGLAWESAASYTARLQAMIEDTVGLLSDTGASAGYDLTGRELATMLRERNRDEAARREAALQVTEGFPETIDSRRGTLLCLIGDNLIRNAIAATNAGRRVGVSLTCTAAIVTLRVADEGRGIPESVRPHLFTAGRSGRPGGSGLGLAISRLIARQIGADIELEHTGPEGTVFRVTLPRHPAP